MCAFCSFTDAIPIYCLYRKLENSQNGHCFPSLSSIYWTKLIPFSRKSTCIGYQLCNSARRARLNSISLQNSRRWARTNATSLRRQNCRNLSSHSGRTRAADATHMTWLPSSIHNWPNHNWTDWVKLISEFASLVSTHPQPIQSNLIIISLLSFADMIWNCLVIARNRTTAWWRVMVQLTPDVRMCCRLWLPFSICRNIFIHKIHSWPIGGFFFFHLSLSLSLSKRWRIEWVEVFAAALDEIPGTPSRKNKQTLS